MGAKCHCFERNSKKAEPPDAEIIKIIEGAVDPQFFFLFERCTWAKEPAGRTSLFVRIA